MRNKKIRELRDVSPETTMIYRLISTNKLLSDTIYAQQKEIEIMKNDPQIKRILNKYTGVKIHSITDIHETLDETIASKDIQQSIKEK